MNTQVTSREEWLRARLELLAQEKAAMRAQDAVAARRRELPRVRIDKDYVFEGPDGKVRLADLFEGRPQLIVYHFMFHPEWEDGCPSCSFTIDSLGRLEHLNGLNTSFVMVSRAPLEKIERYRTRMGWTATWVSSAGSDFNFDFHVTNDESVAPIYYNYKDKATLQRDAAYRLKGDGQGISVFVREGDGIFHTYSTYGRGTEVMMGTYHLLDLTPLGRQGRYVNEFPYHDTYGNPADHSGHAHGHAHH
ncbi:DUF899 domain-containing protein [Micromonospora sp. NPDC049559]|uniref:DUF899 domain-containing protein n=1 Tax=Micromonospora sp. NPDC049559 TaxID=3155923 RepID=UPI00344AE65F